MKQLSRRTFLRGAGKACIALPFLDAMTPAFAQDTIRRPVRSMYVFAPSGMMTQYWTPPTTGSDFEYQRIMKPLEKFRDDILVMSGLSAAPLADPLNDGGGDHARAVASYLTGVRPVKTLGSDFRSGVSADQLAAQVLGQQTRFASLELTCEDSRTIGDCDSYTCAYQTLSWKSPTEPLPPEMNPRLLFDRMFGGLTVGGSPQERAKRQHFRRSILDLTLDDIHSLQRKVGGNDRRKLDEYLTSIEEVESRLDQASNQSKDALPSDFQQPVGIPANYADHARLMFDLMAIAFQTDMTRVVTFMLAREGGLRPYPEIGVPEAHHSISHHRNDPELIEKTTQIECYHLEQFAYFVEKMKSIPDGDGTLLDNCALVYGAAMGDPNDHVHSECPTLIAGRAGGQINPGRHIQFADETPISNLHLTMLDIVGVPTDKLGNSNGKLDFLSDL